MRPPNRILLRPNVFGPSKVIEGSAYVPNEMATFTGKLVTQKVETFHWKPEKSKIFTNFYINSNKKP
jgi:hypothetical protein